MRRLGENWLGRREESDGDGDGVRLVFCVSFWSPGYTTVWGACTVKGLGVGWFRGGYYLEIASGLILVRCVFVEYSVLECSQISCRT
jgi:hypothetical protein